MVTSTQHVRPLWAGCFSCGQSPQQVPPKGSSEGHCSSLCVVPLCSRKEGSTPLSSLRTCGWCSPKQWSEGFRAQPSQVLEATEALLLLPSVSGRSQASRAAPASALTWEGELGPGFLKDILGSACWDGGIGGLRPTVQSSQHQGNLPEGNFR